MSEKKSSCSSCLGKVLLFFAIIALLGFLGINGFMNRANTQNKSNTNILERKANIKDIEITESYKFPISIKITITPNVDIEDLELRIDFYNSSNEILYTKYVEFGDVKSGSHYEENVSVLDLDISVISSEKSSYSVSRGTVKYF